MLKPNHTLYFLPASASCAAQSLRRLAGAVIFFLLFLPFTGLAQERQPLHGRVVYDDMPLEQVLVVNISLQKEVYTNSQGDFTINAKPGDVIAVTGSRVREQKYTLSAEDIAMNPLILNADLQNYEIEEVAINRTRISSSILNLPMGAKYTPAERKLETASSMKPTFYNTMTGGFLPLDPLFNAISGRTKSLKKILETEKKEYTIADIKKHYSNDRIVSELSIPADYADGFLFYAAENKYVAKAFKDGDIVLGHKFLGQLALKYLNLIGDDK